jgi:hypothetical protein
MWETTEALLEAVELAMDALVLEAAKEQAESLVARREAIAAEITKSEA